MYMYEKRRTIPIVFKYIGYKENWVDVYTICNNYSLYLVLCLYQIKNSIKQMRGILGVHLINCNTNVKFNTSPY